MATIRSDQTTIKLKYLGEYIAAVIKWRPVNQFYIEINSGFLVEIWNPVTGYYAKYHGPKTVKVTNALKAFADAKTRFILSRSTGLTAGEFDVLPQPRKIKSVGSIYEQVARALVINENEKTLQALKNYSR